MLRMLALVVLITTPVKAQEILGVYVANQGNFSTNDGSVTWYDLSTGLAENVFVDFGSLAHSLTLDGNYGYVASNTSNAIDVLRLSSNARIGQIPAVASPRYITVISPGKAYVSELYSAQVRVLNLQSLEIMSSVPTGSNPEDIAVVGDRAFVANSGFGADSTLTVINTRSDAVIGTLELGCDGPRHLEVDQEGELWAFCNGHTVYNSDFTQVIERTNGAVVVLDPQTGDVLNRIELDFQPGAGALGQDTFYSPDSEEIFLIRNDPASLLIFDTALNAFKEELVLSGEESVGGLVYDAGRRQLYIGRIVSYTVPGFVQIINRDDLSEAGRFSAGIAPAHLALHQAPGFTSVSNADVPEEVGLEAFPNPFNNSTTLKFSTDEPQEVSLVIYDLLGREVVRLVDGVQSAGRHRITWDAGSLPGGHYFGRLSIGSHTVTRALVYTP